ncbi:MAG: transcription-repair coupling factor [Syntrophobacteraceae bacterium]|nr:transcription-repair coupling factor [Syntrophobacteraceae bacterium]
MSTTVRLQTDLSAFDGIIDTGTFKSDSRKVLSFLKESRDAASIREVTPGALAYLLARGLESVKRPFLVVTSTDREAERLAETVSFFCAKDTARLDAAHNRTRVLYFPSRAGHKSQSLRKMEITARRMEVLYTLRGAPDPRIVVTSAAAVLERLIPPRILMDHTEYRVRGEMIDVDQLCRNLADRGYYHVSLVEEYGDFSRRGGVLDVFSPLYRWPLRLEFFGDELESVRLFHPSTQRSLGTLEDVQLLPASEVILDAPTRERAIKAVYDDVQRERLTPAAGNVWLDKIQEGHQFGAFEAILPVFYENLSTLWDYMDADTVLVWSNPAQVRSVMEEHFLQSTLEWEENRSPHEWRRPPAELMETPEVQVAGAERFQQVMVGSFVDGEQPSRVFDLGVRNQDEVILAIGSHSNRERILEPLAEQFQRWTGDGIHTFLVCGQKEQAKRLGELLARYGMEADVGSWSFGYPCPDDPAVRILTGSLSRGFFWPAEKLAVVSEEEIFGKRRRRQARRQVAGLFLSSFQDLHIGDFVVHVDHGIGIYKELVHLEVRGMAGDFLLIEYQDGDRLYVPVDKLRKVQKYLGVDGQDPRVDKLGGKSWEAAKKKARESAERIAEELLRLYASRQVREGFRFSAPDSYFQEFETTFAYEETPDQIRAIDDVLEDMASGRPMDRLICGDVGYGKTEVAIRAAFKAVMDRKQVAMLVPTTVLAEQHFQSFRDRLTGFPVVVETLSRFKTAAQQKQVVAGLRKGSIDIVIGTHRLLQKDVGFKDLGLLIIDEEHRFGVKHKEKLKEFRVSVDVLTLTATPIPRTLHMAMAGIRDLSTIETPPQDRQAIETYICKYDDFTMREAIYREIQRGGQVFFVHNHVQSIYQMANSLGRLVPEARIAVAHGQMKERDLEKVMLDFIGRKVDVLVCTTIIESGLDIQAANTIIINRADKFGLAQIYQLRGRVGRSSEQAYAYLLIPGEHLIGRDAQKRLRALMDFSELGAGFKIALNDLQIRGGGTILGSSQSGHVAAVGYELYLELIEKTIREMKGEKPEAEGIDPEIHVPLAAFLPDTFIPDNDQRLLAYKRLATLGEMEDVDELAGEWRDRYGPFPESARNLVLLAKLRLCFRQSGIVRMEEEREDFVLYFCGQDQMNRVIAALERKKCAFSPDSDRRLRVEIWGRNLPQRLARLKRILQEPVEHDSDIKLIR